MGKYRWNSGWPLAEGGGRNAGPEGDLRCVTHDSGRRLPVCERKCKLDTGVLPAHRKLGSEAGCPVHGHPEAGPFFLRHVAGACCPRGLLVPRQGQSPSAGGTPVVGGGKDRPWGLGGSWASPRPAHRVPSGMGGDRSSCSNEGRDCGAAAAASAAVGAHRGDELAD